MTKKLISIAVALLLMIPAVFSFVGCNTITDFPDLSGYIANVTDATGIGISRVAKTSDSNKSGGLFVHDSVKRASEQPSTESDGKNYAMVGNDNGYEELSFTKITADTSAELIDGETRVIASFTDDKSVDIVSRNDNSITINVDTTCEYMVTDEDGKVLVEWSRFEQGTHTFTVAQAEKALVESRSLEAKISFNTLEGFEYSIYCKGKPVMEGLRDNDDKDSSKKNGHSEWGYFTEGEYYEIHYKGHGKKDEFTQDKLGADIDKLYTVNGFTFISFVAKGKSNRPSESNSIYWQDGVNAYDKVGYYTDNTRKSFVIDNSTGYVYPLINFNIKYFMGGLLFSDENVDKMSSFVYDFKTTDDGRLNIYQLFSNNKDKVVDSCAKDKYGHKYIMRTFPDGYDNATDTYYFENGEVMCSSNGDVVMIRDGIKVSTEDGSFRELNDSDNFVLYGCSDFPNYKYIVKNGVPYRLWDVPSTDIFGIAQIYINEPQNAQLYLTGPDSDVSMMQCASNLLTKFAMYPDSGYFKEMSILDVDESKSSWCCLSYLEEYDTVLSVENGKLIKYKNVWEYAEKLGVEDAELAYDVIYDGKLTMVWDIDKQKYQLIEDGYNGQTKYEIAVDYVGNTVNFRLVEQSKYSRAPRVVTLQPINR